MSHNILAFAGSIREASFNQKILQIAVDGAREAGAEVTLLNLADYQMPIYNGDLEAGDGLPENALKLKTLFADHDGLLISSPEYNSSLSPLLKNTIDWISRPHDGVSGVTLFQGKFVGIMAASPGRVGGLLGLGHLRQIMTTLQANVIGKQFVVPFAGDAFDDNGGMKDANNTNALKSIGAEIATILANQTTAS